MMSSIPHMTAFAVLLSLMLPVAAIDIRLMIIPDIINAAILVSGLTVALSIGVVSPSSAVAASVMSAIMLSLVLLAFRSLRGYDGLGWGDVKFVSAAATWTGLEGLAFTLLAASITALLYVLGSSMLSRTFNRRSRIPFGPFLALGTSAVAGFQLLSSMSMIDLMDVWLMSLMSTGG